MWQPAKGRIEEGMHSTGCELSQKHREKLKSSADECHSVFL